MFNVNTLGEDRISFKPNDCKASNSTLRAAVPKVFIIPIPLVAPVAAKSVRLSDADPTLATVFRSIPSALPELVPCAPPILLPPLK